MKWAMAGRRRARAFSPAAAAIPEGGRVNKRRSGVLLQQVLSRRVRIQENGVTKSLSVKEIALTQLVNKAAKGDLRAMKLLFDLIERYCGSTGEPAIEIRLLPGDENL